MKRPIAFAFLTLIASAALADELPLGTRPNDSDLRSWHIGQNSARICWETNGDPLCATFAPARTNACSDHAFQQHVDGFLQRNYDDDAIEVAKKLKTLEFADLAALFGRNHVDTGIFAAVAMCPGTNIYALIVDLEDYESRKNGFEPEGIVRLERIQ